jgi:hypothetical protein
VLKPSAVVEYELLLEPLLELDELAVVLVEPVEYVKVNELRLFEYDHVDLELALAVATAEAVLIVAPDQYV